jgi:hypothetical protein
MLGPFDYGLLVTGFLVEIGVVLCAVYRRNFLRHLPLNLYMLCTAFVTVGQYLLLRRWGYTSTEYLYFYYYSDSLLTILLFWVVMHFYQQLFVEMGVRRQMRAGAMLLLAATAVFSYAVVHHNRSHLTTRFVVELGQNLYFVGVVLTYVLWGAILKLRETRTRLIQLVLALGVYFSATAGTYALRNLFPALQQQFLHWVPPIVGLWLPVAWAYTFAMVADEARLATAKLAVRTR